MTPEYIAFHAIERPGAVAAVIEGRETTYADFARDIRKCTRALRDFGLRRGARVALDCDDFYLHWLLRVGFEQLGVVTTSLSAADDPKSWPRFVGDFDLLLSGKGPSSESIRQQQQITPQWLERVLAAPDVDDEPAWAQSPDDPLRIAFTSGTTGSPKRLLFTRRNHENSIAKSMWFNGFTHRSRNLLSMPLSVAGSYTNATACIRSGGRVVVEHRMAPGDAIAAHGITHTTLSPIALRDVVDALPSDFERPADLTVFTWGAAISRVLRDKVLARLATDLCDIYGSNEASATSLTRGNAEFGSVLPKARVEVVDDHDRPLPFGEMGQIRVKTDCMVDGYLDDPVATQRKFRDGWFYAGDLGILHDAGRLQVIGRSDDLLNIGWSKFSPSTLEDIVLRAVNVGDVGICSLPNADGIEEICVALADAPGRDPEIMEGISRAFHRLQLGKFYVMRMERIPRNENGKIQRDLLKQAAAQSMRNR
jgi:acyl-CoA synthetase (AMP-forming)/AMP-acid ligase II